MTLWFWQKCGGALYEEFRAVDSNQPHHAVRYLDGLIVLGEPTTRMERGLRPDIRDKDVVIVQTKNERLGMYLMGQTLFSRELVQRFGPRSIRSVAVVKKTDDVLQPLLEVHGCEVEVCPPEICALRTGSRRKIAPTEVGIL
jgi:hypothetical protein